MGGESPALSELRKANQSMQKGINNSINMLGKTRDDMLGTLNEQYQNSQNDLKTYYGKAISQGEPWAQAGLQAYQSYVNQFKPENAEQNLQNFLGSAGVRSVFGEVNSGQDAFDNFKNSIGYDFTYDQAMKAQGQAASAGGYLSSPRMQMAMQKQAAGLADQTYTNYAGLMQNAYGQYLGGMQNAASTGLTAMQGQQQANIGLGTALANAHTGYGSDVANTQQWYGTNMSSAYLAKGQTDANYRLVRAGMFAPSSANMMTNYMNTTANTKI